MGRAVRKAVKKSQTENKKTNDRSKDYNLLMSEYAPLIKVSVDHIKRHSKLPLDQEDLLAAALTGLFEALENFDPIVDRSFRSFAELKIHKSLLDEIRPMADFYQHVRLQPVGAAEATHHMPKLTFGYDWKGHKYNTH